MAGTADGGEGNVRLEHEHEVVELGAPFAQVFGPEIVDANLSDFEFRLLVYLRITAATNGSTWVSHRQMAKHLGKNERTIKRAYSELLQKGFAKSQKRSWAQSSKKFLTAPSKIYKADRMRRFFKYLRSDATESDIAYLRRAELDNPENSIGDKNVPNVDLDSRDNSFSDKNAPSIGDKNAPSLGTKTSTSRSRSKEVDQDEVDQTSDASHRECKGDNKDDQLIEEDQSSSGVPKGTGGDRYRAHWKPKPHGKTLENPSDNERQAATQAAVDAGETTTPQLVDRGRQRALDRREAKRLADESPESPELSARTREKLRGKKGPNAKDVKQLYFEKAKDCFPGAKIGRWGSKELAHAKALLDDYGWDLVESVVTAVYERWSAYGERMNNKGEYPTIAWIYGCRQQLFSEIQKQKKPRQAVPATGKRKKQGELLG